MDRGGRLAEDLRPGLAAVESLSPRRALLFAAGTVLATTVAGLALVEGLLRLPRGGGSPETPVKDYGDAVRGGDLGPGGLLREGFEGRLADGRGGTIFWKNNAAGFRNVEETAREPAPGAVRILSMGDSFTAGYRVDQEATFSRLLERELRGRGVRAEVLVSEIEQPATGLWWLLHGGLDWRPAAVLFGVTLGNDVAQSFFAVDPPGEFSIGVRDGVPRVERSGPAPPVSERREFGLRLPPGALVPGAPVRLLPARRPLRLLDLLLGPPPQPIGSSRAADMPPFLFDGVNGLGIFLKDPPPPVRVAFERLDRVLLAAAAAVRQRGAGFLVVVFPQRFQVQDEDWHATVAGYGLDAAAFDLEAPGRRIAAFCAANGIPFLDLAGPLRGARRGGRPGLYLPGGDMHWSADGHRAAAAAILPELARNVPRALP